MGKKQSLSPSGDQWAKGFNRISSNSDLYHIYSENVRKYGQDEKGTPLAERHAVQVTSLTTTLLAETAQKEGWSVNRFIRTGLELASRMLHPENGRWEEPGRRK